MKLTDELRAQMVSALKQSFPRMTEAGWEPELTERECVIAAAAYSAGREDMRERAAAECDHFQSLSASHKCGACMAGVIRALGVDDD